MFTAYSENLSLMCPSKSLLLMDPVLELAMNEAGSFSFSLPFSHPAYEQLAQSARVTPSRMMKRNLLKFARAVIPGYL